MKPTRNGKIHLTDTKFYEVICFIVTHLDNHRHDDRTGNIAKTVMRLQTPLPRPFIVILVCGKSGHSVSFFERQSSMKLSKRSPFAGQSRSGNGITTSSVRSNNLSYSEREGVLCMLLTRRRLIGGY